MVSEKEKCPPLDSPASSDRLRIRSGRLARTAREDPQAELERREPDELFEPLALGEEPEVSGM